MKKIWIATLASAVIFGGIGYYVGSTSTTGQATTVSGAGKTFVTRGAYGGGAGVGATIGTVIQTGSGTFTIQLPASTSSTATTGTKLVLVDNSTQVQELQSVPTSNIQTGQMVTVAGITNSDGSITASNVMIRPSTSRNGAGASAGAQISTQ
ncbi:MAG: DUF5666 domain-containing protein [Candidatus Pacebacteria bacterium]|nr:DUF5666 domain-containing protein [Candidatus Paceibacterota bacterium]